MATGTSGRISLSPSTHQDSKNNVNDHEDETEAEFRHRLILLLAQMMFVSGETAEASIETTYLIEEIVREQVIEMVGSLLLHRV